MAVKLLLVNISKFWSGRTYKEYPHGVGILATLARNAGHEVKILDMAVDATPVEKLVRSFSPDVIGLSFLSMSWKIARETIALLKSIYSGYIISGGVHTSLYPLEVVRGGVDIAVVGEGEVTMIKLLKYLDGKPINKIWNSSIAQISNIAYINGEGEAILTNSNHDSVNLDELPIMDRSLFSTELYAHHSILTSRVCPYKCNFCCSWAPGGKNGRMMSPERIMSELKYLTNTYGSLNLYWGDEIFFWDREERLNFCKKLAHIRLPITFTAQVRADIVDNELVQALVAAGCVKICFGAESGSDDILRTANKHISAAQTEQAIKICAQAGLRTKTWWLVGLPGGGMEHQLMALDIIERTRPNEVAVHQFVPLPGTEFWNNAEQYGISLPNENLMDTLTYYADIAGEWFNYLSIADIHNILRQYEAHLRELGYVSTDEADEHSMYVYTTPFQKSTFNV
ncbi:MAG: B12-binding domain-containing radical SAM protein [Spirochaetes bacterium]|nr:B12-binding domain-containing radical SAM protein [Spirochaetota bacterium]